MGGVPGLYGSSVFSCLRNLLFFIVTLQIKTPANSHSEDSCGEIFHCYFNFHSEAEWKGPAEGPLRRAQPSLDGTCFSNPGS